MGSPHSKSSQRAKRDIIARLNRFLTRHPHLTDAEVAKGVGVRSCTVNKWRNGNSAPNAPIRANLASYMDAIDKRATLGKEPDVVSPPPGVDKGNGVHATSKRVDLVLRLAMALDDEDRTALVEALLVTL